MFASIWLISQIGFVVVEGRSKTSSSILYTDVLKEKLDLLPALLIGSKIVAKPVSLCSQQHLSVGKICNLCKYGVRIKVWMNHPSVTLFLRFPISSQSLPTSQGELPSPTFVALPRLLGPELSLTTETNY